MTVVILLHDIMSSHLESDYNVHQYNVLISQYKMLFITIILADPGFCQVGAHW